MNILIMGAPGSGKGTQAESLVRRLGIPAISTGDMIRRAVAAGSDVGVRAADYINKGALVPDEVMIDIVLERLKADDCINGYILDGFPRTLAQAEAMDLSGTKIDAAIFMDVSDDVVLKRLGGRRVCSKCGAVYHITSLPSKKEGICDVCYAPLIVRDDDNRQTILKRLEVYKKQTGPVIEYYRGKGLLLPIDADNDKEEISDFIVESIVKGRSND